MKNPYETLGVEPTATAAEIKAAWRKLSAKHHPDRGGDTATAAEINAAYDVLSNPQRRLDHDMGVNPDSIEAHAEGVLVQMFDAVLESTSCRNPVKEVAVMLDTVRAEMTNRIAAAKKRTAFLERRLGRFKKDAGLVKMMIERKLQDAARTIATSERALEINARATTLLEGFAYDTDPDPSEEARRRMHAQATGTALFGRYGGTGLGGMWP